VQELGEQRLGVRTTRLEEFLAVVDSVEDLARVLDDLQRWSRVCRSGTRNGVQTLVELLPGLRQIRAPLAAGYLWLLTILLIVEPGLPSRADARGLPRSVIELVDAAGPIATAVAVGFLAYLVGSVSDDLTSTLARRIGRGAPQRILQVEANGLVSLTTERGYAGGYTRNKKYLYLLARPIRMALGDGVLTVPRVPIPTSEDEYHRLRVRVEDETMPVLDRLAAASSDKDVVNLVTEVLPPSEFLRFRFRTGSAAEQEAASITSLTLAHALTEAVGRELESIGESLIDVQPQLFGEFDRFRGEADFRVAISLPLVVLAMVACVEASPLWLLSFGGIGILLSGAHQRRHKSNDRVVQAILEERVTAPTLLRFARHAQAFGERA
jgi:hypothetical protein